MRFVLNIGPGAAGVLPVRALRVLPFAADMGAPYAGSLCSGLESGGLHKVGEFTVGHGRLVYPEFGQAHLLPVVAVQEFACRYAYHLFAVFIPHPAVLGGGMRLRVLARPAASQPGERSAQDVG